VIDVMHNAPEFVLAAVAAERRRQFLADAHDARQCDQGSGTAPAAATFVIAVRSRAVTGAARIRSLRVVRWQPRLGALGDS
jgi:hypothetical protein